MQSLNKDIRTTVDEEKKEVVIIIPKQQSYYDKFVLKMVIDAAYDNKATFTYYELNDKLICVLKAENIEGLLNIF